MTKNRFPLIKDEWGRLPVWVRWYVFVWCLWIVTRRKIAETWLSLVL